MLTHWEFLGVNFISWVTPIGLAAMGFLGASLLLPSTTHSSSERAVALAVIALLNGAMAVLAWTHLIKYHVINGAGYGPNPDQVSRWGINQ